MTDVNKEHSLLSIRNLAVSFQTADGEVAAVKGIDLDLGPGECLGVVGESGSGKSQAMHAVMGLLDRNGQATGSIQFQGQELLGLSVQKMNALRGSRIAMIFQDPLTSLTPHLKIGRQMQEVLACHESLGRAEQMKRVQQSVHLLYRQPQ